MHSGNPPESFGPKYKPIKVVGRGTWGVVTQCRSEAGEIVALKTFEGADKNELVRKVAVREAKVLKQVDHPNIVRLIEVFRTKSNLYLVFEFVEYTLLDCIQRHRYGVPHVQLTTLLLQLAQAIDFLHSKNIIHRDLKPENTLVTKDGQVKLADFGFARSVPQLEGAWTAYVSTRWYRAPEMLLGSEYGAAADIWAFGCILAEMATGRPLFPGSSDLDQLHQIMCTTGICQSQKDIIKSHSGLSRLTAGFPDDPVANLNSRLPHVDANIVAVVKACLRPDPKARPSSSQLLQFDFFQTRREPLQKSSSVCRPSTVPAISTTKPVRSVAQDADDSMFAPALTMTTLGEPGLGRRNAQNNTNPMQGGKKPILSVRPSEARHSQLSSSLRDCEADSNNARFVPTPVAFSQQSFTQQSFTQQSFTQQQYANVNGRQYANQWGQAANGFASPPQYNNQWSVQGAMMMRNAQFAQQMNGQQGNAHHANGWTQGAIASRLSEGGVATVRAPSAGLNPRASEPGGGGGGAGTPTMKSQPSFTSFKMDLKAPSFLIQTARLQERHSDEPDPAAADASGRHAPGAFASRSYAPSPFAPPPPDVPTEVSKLRRSSVSNSGQGPPTPKESDDSLFAPTKAEVRLPSLF